VTSSPAGVHCGGQGVTCTGWFVEGASVTLTPVADAGTTFAGWFGACEGTGTCVVSMVGTKTVTALFSGPLTLSVDHLDVLGSVRAVTDSSTPYTVLKRHDYFAFGEDPAPMTGDPIRFTGKELDAETALQYFGARYLRNGLGRFTSVDPGQAGGDPKNPQSWNAYAYVQNNPLRYLDPDGRQLLPAQVAQFLVKYEPQIYAALRTMAAAKGVTDIITAMSDLFGSVDKDIRRAINSGDPHQFMVGFLASSVKQQFPGTLVGINQEQMISTSVGGIPFTEFDIELSFAIIEVKTGKNWLDLRQLSLQQMAGKPVIIYAPEAANDATGQKKVRDKGGYVALNEAHLIFLLNWLRK
jgi:RHS repeat-associated protein